jgi:chromosomal replication initiation ATPase DnaA
VNSWDLVVEIVRRSVPDEDFRRWFSGASYASDTRDQISVWVPTEAARQQLDHYYQKQLRQALEEIGRRGTRLRFLVAGLAEDEDDLEDS